jgi:hypothetical protein
MNKIKYDFSIIILIIVLAGLLASCKTIDVTKPDESYSNYLPEAKASIVSFSAQSKISDIQNELNMNFSGLIYEDNSLDNNGGDNIMVKAWKQGDIKIDMKGNVLSYSIPLKTWIKAGVKFQKFGISLSDYRELNAALVLAFKTAITLNPDWTITTKTTSDGYEWTSTPVVNIGGIDISVKFVADLIMQSSLKDMGEMIDESIKEYLNLKPYAQKAWDIAVHPVKLNDQYNIWLQITPQKLVSSKVNAENGLIVHRAGMSGLVKLSVGKDSIQTVKAKPLPNLLVEDSFSDVTTLYAYVSIPFSELSNTASTFVKGKSFEHGKKKVTVEDIKIYGNQGNLIAETTLTGSLNGKIYFRGKPAFNESDSTLVTEGFDYDISTKNFLVKSASWLYQDGLRKMIANQLKWSIREDMVMIRSTVNNNLKAYKLAEGITLNGNVTRVDPGTVYITSDGIICEIIARGKFAIKIEKLSIKD